MAYGFIPMSWRQVKVTFIPKPGKLDYTEAKAYRPISLLSFLLKTMEKLLDRHIRGGVLRNQHAYRTCTSTETALHNVVTHIESAIKHKNIALGAFLDIEGAFDRTSFDIIRTRNMQVDKCDAGKQDHNCYIIRKNPGGVRV
jgi:hypothetical protein